ncbi:MAG TPA: glycosyltransferase family 39 protein [Candidatus Binataceae bacterium]|nr:glycosyltransferase family 39 protein [Candidatus Binataceae bacterium]
MADVLGSLRTTLEAADQRAAAGRFERAASWHALLPFLMVALPAAALFFFHLGAYGLWEPDEGRYAEIAREMLATGNYLVPQMNYVPYVEKPPLLYWLTALSMRGFGVNEFAARSVNAIAALIGVVAVYYFTLRVFDRRHAVFAGLILTTCALYAVMAQVLTTDMLLTATVTVALFALYLHWCQGGQWWWLIYVSAGLAVLTKGPIGAVIPAAAGLIFLALEGDLRGVFRRFHVVAGAMIILLITGPWFVAMGLRQPDFLDFYFVGEHLRRFFDASYSHAEPFYYYVPIIFAGTLPWSLTAPFWRWRGWASSPPRRFCLVTTAVIFTIFSAASAKLIPYLLPAFPCLAILLADRLLSSADNNGGKRLAWGGGLMSAAGLATIVVGLVAADFSSPNPGLVRAELLAAGGVLTVGGALVFVLFRWRPPLAGLSAIAATAAVVLLIASYGRLAAESSRSYAALARTIARRAPDARLICYPRYIDALPFYTQRRVILVGPKTELAYGAAHAADGPAYFFDRRADVIRLWREPEPSVLVVDRPAFRTIEGALGAYRVVASDGRKIAVTQASPPAAKADE